MIVDVLSQGKVCMQQLHVRSLFNREMDVTGIASVPPDPQVSFEYKRQHDSSFTLPVPPISPLNISSIGVLTFNPAIGCRDQCYLGISANTTSKEWRRCCYGWKSFLNV